MSDLLKEWETLAETDGAYAIALALHEVAHAIIGLQEAVRSDHPLQGETLDGIREALNGIGNAIEEHK
jgi:hypothetical protein